MNNGKRPVEAEPLCVMQEVVNVVVVLSFYLASIDGVGEIPFCREEKGQRFGGSRYGG